MIRHFLNPPNWFTSASIFCSTYALALLMTSGVDSSSRVLSRACVLVIFGGVFDLLDGRVARMTKRLSDFGVQLDSIADVISFGIAPAMLAWTWRLHELGMLGAIITFWYVLTAAFRLARFNVDTQSTAWSLAGHSRGLTTTMAGGSAVTLVWISNGYLRDVLHPPAWAVAIFLAFLGLLMVSSIPFRHFKDVRRSPVARLTLAVSLSLCLASAVVFDVSMLFGVGASLYLTWGMLDGIATALHHRRTHPRSDGGMIAEFVREYGEHDSTPPLQR